MGVELGLEVELLSAVGHDHPDINQGDRGNDHLLAFDGGGAADLAAVDAALDGPLQQFEAGPVDLFVVSGRPEPETVKPRRSASASLRAGGGAPRCALR